MKKLYYLLYYKLVLTTSYVDRKTSNNSGIYWSKLKAGILLLFLLIPLSFDILTIIEIVIKKSIYNRNNDIPAYVYITLLVGVNYYLFEYKNKWIQYNQEFVSYSRKKNYIINAVIISIYIIAIVLFFITSEIWGRYYHAGLIRDY